MSTFGWKVIGLTYVAVALPILGALLPRGAPTNWPWLIAALAGAGATLCANAYHLRRMVISRGFREPPAGTVLVEVVVGTISAGMLNYAIGGQLGLYRPLVFIPTLLIAMVGSRLMIALSWATAVLAVTWPALALGSLDRSLPAFVVSYGASWGIAATMVHLLATASLQSDRQMLGLAEVAGLAARAHSLVDGLEQMLPVIARWAEADCIAAFRVRLDDGLVSAERAPEPLRAWPEEAAETCEPPTRMEIAAARADQGVWRGTGRSVLVAEGGSEELVVTVLEGAAPPRLDRLVDRFNLERMAQQLDVLVNRSRYIARLEELGRTDGLTSLPNRRALTDRLTAEVQVARRRGDSLSLAMVDLDDFKAYNDAHGHLAGDGLLRAFAGALRARMRAGDFVARYGGEEFCIVLPGTDLATAEAVLADVHAWLRGVEAVQAVTFSAGIAAWDGVEPADGLLRRADEALYVAKDAGRDRSASAPPGLPPRP